MNNFSNMPVRPILTQVGPHIFIYEPPPRPPQTIGDVPPTQILHHRHPEYAKREVLNSLAARQLRQNWPLFTQTTLDKLNIIRSVTGEKKKRLLQAIFQHDLYRLQLPTAEQADVPSFLTDIPSLWASAFRRGYIEAINRIYLHMEAHERGEDHTRNDKKALWVPEGTPLALHLLVPWEFDPVLNMSPVTIANYFENDILIGCACKIHHEYCGDLEMFYSLMRHNQSPYIYWIPMYPQKGE